MFDSCLMDTAVRKLSSHTKQLVSEFASPTSIGRRFLLGRNEHSKALVNVFEVDGFIDDYAQEGETWEGKPVINGDNVPGNAILVNCSMSISPISASRRINELVGVEGLLTYSDLYSAFPEKVKLPEFVEETRKDVSINLSKWCDVRKGLGDDISKQVFDDVFGFRMTGDIKFMNSYSVRLREQYFEKFLNLSKGEVFVDAGGFDGDTSEEFCIRCPDYKKVFLFEPSAINLEKAKNRLKKFSSIDFIPFGVSDAKGTLWFNPEAGSASAVSESGSCRIDVVSIDEKIQEDITFLKMDLEGWELKALEGAKQHIQEDHPKLAISVYHYSSDFWKVFQFVINLRQDYKVYLRHYTEGWSETVMFFIPIES